MRRLLFFMAAVAISTISAAQQVSNVHAELSGSNVKITYDLLSDSPSSLFEVNLYSSVDNFSAPLKLVTGDVGKSIKPGKGHTILWKIQEELGTYKGEITWEVRALLLGDYYTITNPTSYSKIKKGKTLMINWQGGNPAEKVEVQLLRSGFLVSKINDNLPNQGSYNWLIPKTMKPSKDYHVKIINTSNTQFAGISKSFKIGGKFPVALVIIPSVAVIGAVAYLATQKPPVVIPPVENNTALPTPPVPPTK